MYVLTGAPGCGKTTMIDLLENEYKFTVGREVARELIEDQQRNGGDCLPWINLALFQGEVSQRQYLLEQQLPHNSFLDRSMIDSAGYCKEANISYPTLTNHIESTYQKVFFLEQLPHYQTDEQRVEEKTKANSIEIALLQTYAEFGHEVVRVPVLEPKERVQYILERMEKK